MDTKKVFDFLKQNEIEYKLHEHHAVFTCEEAEEHCGHIPGIHSKNLFLKSRKPDKYYLVILPEYKRLDLKKMEDILGVKLSFAAEKYLISILGLKQGSVSPFGLINDTEKITSLYIDEDVLNSDIISYHPNVNTATLELTQDNFRKYLGCLDLEYKEIKM